MKNNLILSFGKVFIVKHILFLSTGFRGWSSMKNFDFRVWAEFWVLTSVSANIAVAIFRVNE
jgi:hypothetical protein